MITDKPTVFMTACIATTGGVRAQSQIRETLLSRLAETSLDFALQALARLTKLIRARSPVPD